MHIVQLSARNYLVIYGIPILILLVSVGLALSPMMMQHPALVMGITYDLTLTAPIVYLVLIWRKKIPRITAVPIFVLGLLLATFLLPENRHLHGVTTWLLPIIELTVMSTIGYKIIQFRRAYKNQRNDDFLTLFRKIGKEVLGSATLANVMATEASVFHYAFFNWRKVKSTPSTFTYHQKSAINSTIIGIIIVLFIETIAIHFIVASGSAVAAWILTGSSIYLAIQLFSHLKAVSKRLISIEEDTLTIRYGLFADATIALNNIKSIEFFKGELKGNGIKKIALLGDLEDHNICIKLKNEVAVIGVYGLTKKYNTLLLFVDDTEKFKARLDRNRALLY